MIFLDRSIPKSVAEALKLVRTGDIVWLEDQFAHDTPDEDWIPTVAARGWLTISRDKKIRTRLRQRALVRDHGMGCFIIAQKQDPTRWQYLKLLAANLDDWERVFDSTPKPFLHLVDAAGKSRDFPLR
ncbi:MAG TPA: hypothetical protein PL082_06090 [Tepidiformaceae bacterium]|nr:hypothetical protein [Tepidiformaceae bacterium]